MNNSAKYTFSGILWGVALGIPGAVLGGFVGFSLFGLYFFADTAKASLLVGASALIGFAIVFFISFFYWRGREVASLALRIVVPFVIIVLEIFCGLLVLYFLNNYTKQASPTPSVIDSTLSAILEKTSTGTYHVVADVKENSLTCWCPHGMQCKPCVEQGHLVLQELPKTELEVYVDLPKMKPISNLEKGQSYLFTIENKEFNGKMYYYLIDFEHYGLNN